MMRESPELPATDHRAESIEDEQACLLHSTPAAAHMRTADSLGRFTLLLTLGGSVTGPVKLSPALPPRSVVAQAQDAMDP